MFHRGARVALHKASLSPPVISFPDHSKAVLLLWIDILSFLSVMSVSCSLVVTCWERADLLALCM